MKRGLLLFAAASLSMSPIVSAQTPAKQQGTALNFVDARLSDVVRSLALSLGLNVVLTDVPDKRITFTTAAPVERSAVGEILESILESNGLVMIQKGSVAQVMTLDKAPAQALHTYVISLKYAAAEDLASALGRVYGSSVTTGSSQTLDDRSLSRNLDAFRQREATAFQMRRDTPITPPSVSTPSIPTTSGTDATPGAPGTGNLIGQTTIVANPSTNSLIIRTVPPNYSLLRETVEALDTRPPQVLFEVLVAEIALGKTQQFGVDWSAVNGTTTAQFGSPSAPDTSTSIDDFVLRVVSLDRF